MNLLRYFTRRPDNRAEPFDPEAYEAELNARLSARREKRPAHREAGLKGVATKRRASWPA